MYMVIKVKTIIIPLLITYILIAGLISFKFANLCLAIAVVCFLAYLFSHSSKKEVVVKSYISNIPRDLLYNDNTLINSHCIVMYFPNRRIAVIDNPKSGEHTPLRIFSVDKTNYADVNACWTEVCSVFDSYMTLDNLFSFIDKNTGSINVIYLTPGTDFSVVQGVEDFIPKESLKKKEAPKPLIKNPELVKKISDKENKSAIVVDFKDLKQYDVAPANKKDYEKNVVAMSNFIDSKDKIDVNFADIKILAGLPGIDEQRAGEIVKYRNLNGFFKNKEDFFKVSGAKEDFREKIFSAIAVDEYKKSEEEQNPENNK